MGPKLAESEWQCGKLTDNMDFFFALVYVICVFGFFFASVSEHARAVKGGKLKFDAKYENI